MWTTSSLNVYLGCEEAGGGFSTNGGTVLRYNLYDTSQVTAMFDFSLHSAGNFDAVTNIWVHSILVVTPQSLLTYDDGIMVNDAACSLVTAGDATQHAASTTTNAVRDVKLGQRQA